MTPRASALTTLRNESTAGAAARPSRRWGLGSAAAAGRRAESGGWGAARGRLRQVRWRRRGSTAARATGVC